MVGKGLHKHLTLRKGLSQPGGASPVACWISGATRLTGAKPPLNRSACLLPELRRLSCISGRDHNFFPGAFIDYRAFQGPKKPL